MMQYDDEVSNVVYDEEDEVYEMYFVLDGAIGVAFSLITHGFSGK